MSQKLLAICVVALLVSIGTSAQAQDELGVPFEIVGRTMGPVPYKVMITKHSETVTPEELQSVVESTLERVNQLMSTYIPESDVSRFNTTDSTEFVDVNSETAAVVARAIEISEQTEGAFDITVGPAVDLWNFGPNKKEFSIPTEQQISEVKKLIGFQKLSVRADPPAIKKSEPGLRIDLSAIAKGYAVDQVAKALKENGCEFMVEVGGEVTTFGERPDGGPWRIGIEQPTTRKDAPPGKPAQIALLLNRSMATSGDYRNFETFQGKRYSHTIDPETCRPVTHFLASACIIADDCMTADALATAVTVMGNEKGASLCKSLGVEFFLLDRDSEFGMTFKESKSAGFPLMAESDEAQSPENKISTESIWPAFVGAAVIFGLAILGMAVGSIFANKPVTGSCGGIANMTNAEGDEACGVCSKPTTDCVDVNRDEGSVS